ncbi:phenylethanolamine N-methyltransferase [Clarias gariepinus]|uniref:phenylethanolamine N-methyltransferase n=1 Tax=Clarias gariepinus TaxID=13013 RepID=UPI00234DE267|nr:phenylethanolamine N-methyltransferase [Clarias gariepinus]
MEEGNRRDRAVAAVAALYRGFDPEAYLKYNYTPPRADFSRADSIVPWKLNCLHKAFREDAIKGDVLVDIGSGPTLYQVMSGCEHFKRVILSDFLEVNRKHLNKWLKDGQSSFDWTPYLKYVCELEGRGSSAWREKAERLRSVVTDIFPVNVHHSFPFPSGSLPASSADCLVSSFCLESVSPDVSSFTQSLRNVSSLLRSGGHLLLIGALGESFYMAAPDVRIPVVPLDEAQVCASLSASGFDLLQLSVYRLPPDMLVGVDDTKGVFFAKARKP